MGISYYPNGNIYQEGIFGIKGLLIGKEYYPNGQVRFAGSYKLHQSYGPNPPLYGSVHDPEGSSDPG